eukprot:SAG25_NODE_1906_length_2158_cov_2.636717_1_plen_95_part_10
MWAAAAAREHDRQLESEAATLRRFAAATEASRRDFLQLGHSDWRYYRSAAELSSSPGSGGGVAVADGEEAQEEEAQEEEAQEGEEAQEEEEEEEE